MNTQREGFLTVDQMMNYYPLLTVIFDVAFNTLKTMELSQEDIQQLKLEANTFFKSIIHSPIGFSDDYEELSEEAQEEQCKQVGSLLYFASVMNLLAESINQISATDNHLN
ncbi:hypothetical protein QV06_03545 [Gallibacterium genomosp. 3]|uniref:Uncharacterized protein n=1 Tax=Gallibacterium genomosp. 3 TaxID=505345 RepID=A0A1A7PVV0_9PAST|nr:hypothetical protein [Gallibacterium genomosp. 3]OBX05285.1 hypothetical protein QV06_03545 [Gallibacterium genomosp. 3]